MEFRHRFVDFSTNFTGAPGVRQDSHTNPAALHANELAVDVGGVCWGYQNVGIPVLDHHFPRENQFPSASAAVLHFADRIWDRFGATGFDTIWLVTHRDPDFDAFTSMRLARSVVESGRQPSDWLTNLKSSFDWGRVQPANVPPGERWRVLLASVASHVDQCWPMPVARHRALHSVLYAALVRGRGYLGESDGAMEFYDETRHWIERGLNPLVDSVLEQSETFAPELQLLDREEPAYHRDLARARKAVVYLPRTSGPYAELYARARARPLLRQDGVVDRSTFGNAELVEPADGIYLRDPESLLFKEWARLDRDAAPLSGGFLFTAVAYSRERAGSQPNESSYYFAIDPQRAGRHHLYPVWARLQAREIAAIQGPDQGQLHERLLAEERQAAAEGRTLCRHGYELRAGSQMALFSDPWFDGGSYDGTIVVAPHRGTVMGSAGQRADLTDDLVVQTVQLELETGCFADRQSGTAIQGADYSLTAGELHGEWKSRAGPQHSFRKQQFSAPVIEPVPPIPSGCFRFASIDLVVHADLHAPGVARQIGAVLWRLLDPEGGEGVPEDFTQRHLYVQRDWMGVWNRRGLVVATTPRGQETAALVGKRFEKLMDIAGRVHELTRPGGPPFSEVLTGHDDLLRQVAHLKYDLALPENHLLRSFFDAVQLGQVLESLRDVNLAADTYAVAEVQRKVEWVEIFLIGLYGAELLHILLSTAHEMPASATAIATLLIGPPIIGLSAFLILTPWHGGRWRPVELWVKPLLRIVIVVLCWIILVLLVYPKVGQSASGQRGAHSPPSTSATERAR